VNEPKSIPERRVVVISAAARQIVPLLRERPGVEVLERYDLADTHDEDSLADALTGAFAVVAASERYTRAVFERVPQLRAVVRHGVGYDAIDLDAASDAGVAVLTTPGANAEAVADMALALLLSCIRGLRALDGAVRDGTWRPAAPSRDLAGATVAIIGLGAIGRAVARRLRAFDCELLAVEPEPDAEVVGRLGIEVSDLHGALARADAVTVHAALTPATRHLLGARELALLPAHAVVVNTSRGGLIDQTALVEALRAGRLAAAGLDVFEAEPPATDDPLLALPNVVLSGHVSSFTALGMTKTSEAVLERLEALLDGRLPEGVLNRPRGADSQAAADRPRTDA
jgi:D-3-phosphoglycerate dehydrogenase / 2-oxoglutarate reductase